MIVGLLPEIRGSLAALATTGQASRFIDGYLRPYARAFDGVRYFSYRRESLADYTADTELRAAVRVLPGSAWHPWLYALAMPLRHAREFRGCAVLRAFQVTGVVPALVAKRLFGVPFVTTYGFWYGELARSAVSGALRRAAIAVGLRAADAIIVTTPALAADVERRAGDRRRIVLIPNGVDTARFTPGAPAPGGERTILYVGRLASEKSLDTLVAAAAKLTGRFAIRVRFVGDGPLREPLASLARERGVELTLSPVVDHARLPEVYRAADVFVLPSLTEGHPKVLLEAMSCGLACVASAVAGNRAIVADGDTGVLFDPRDADALAAAIERVLTDADLARELGARARARIVEAYDLGALVAREIELLRRVARDAGRAHGR